MMNKAKHWIDWISIKAVGLIYFLVDLLDKYDHVLDVFTKNIGRLSIIIGTFTVIVRLIKTLREKGVNGG
jgi:membrane protein required for beta-lactamase induction